MKLLSRLPFKTRLTIFFSLTLVVTLSFIVVPLTKVATERILEDNRAHLSLLTEQVLINFDQYMSSTDKQLYNLCNSLNIAAYMRDIIENEANTQSLRDLQYAVNQMVSTILPFDFVMVKTLNGIQIHTGGKLIDGASLAEQASSLLRSGLDRNTYGSCVWHRTSDGSIYIVRDVYRLSPLQRVGKVIARLSENRLFSLGSAGESFDSTIMFFDKNDMPIMAIGDMELQQQEIIMESLADRIGSNIPGESVESWNGQEYYYTIHRGKTWKAVGLIPISRLVSMRVAVVTTGIIVGIIGLIIGVFMVTLLTGGFLKQLNALIRSMDAVGQGDMEQIVPVYSEDDIGQLAVHFNSMTRRISELMQRIIEEEKYKKATEFQLLEYRYRSLQTQINPHFIYNVFETVNALAKLDNNAEVANVIQLISRYFRQSTRNMNARCITLDSEFTSLRDYAEIYRYIYGERVRIEFDCPEKLRKALIPSMVLQPVLENALVHGIKANDDESLIIVSAKEDKDKLLVSIKDHGPGMPEDIKKQILSNDAVDAGAIQSQHHSGIGLRNVIERLRLIYGDLVSFEIDSGSDGTEICITIPVNYIVPENNYDYPI